ncbi:hypothetical protein Q3G72_017670 [Acer saccharum]|nr:hypothetical protein Q3G72_017670 [Acer saccharum]
MASVTASVAFSAIGQPSCEKKVNVSATRCLASNFEGFRFRTSVLCNSVGVRASNSTSRLPIQSMSTVTDVPPTVADTKSNFLKAYKRPIPSIYNTVLQELIVQQHLMSDEDREAIFQAYINALKENPEQYRIDAQKLEEWAQTQTPDSLIGFAAREGEIEGVLKDIAERAGSKGSFSYSRFFAIGLFRLLELANATEPTVLEKLCAALNVDKRSVDRDLDVYRNLLSKLLQAKELLKEYVAREKKKREERTESQKASEAVTKCLGEQQYVRHFNPVFVCAEVEVQS